MKIKIKNAQTGSGIPMPKTKKQTRSMYKKCCIYSIIKKIE